MPVLPNTSMTQEADGSYAQQVRPVRVSTAVTGRVTASVSPVTLFAANAERNGAKAQNESSAVMYVKLGAAASPTDYSEQVPGGALWTLDNLSYSGIITAVWSSATGAAQTTSW